MFKVRLEKPEPHGVKISKKNVCLVTITKNDDLAKEEDDKEKLIEYFLQQREPDWATQFKLAVMLGPSIDEENIILEDVSLFEAIMHFASIGWKVFFALVPPANYGGGGPSFVASLAMIGLVTAIVGEIAGLLGCALDIPESVTAITLVALGTSLPDTFASMTAARSSENADSAIGNITGSNSVNVFLGLGLPWVIATVWQNGEDGEDYFVPAGSLGFSVVVFIIVALCCIAVLLIRRKLVQGELGGSSAGRTGSCILLISLWLIYIIMSTL
mmetsp:Transcript_36488/g.56014  ORF Transcript_36488/g.56014 Transcript_36488/m.56014 type:complete len:272 (+) Transcript_36488:2016-2831(+)